MLILSEVVFDAFRTIESFDTLFPETATRFLTVNGLREPTITMRPGEVQRWRLLHAGYQDDIFLELEGTRCIRSHATVSRFCGWICPSHARRSIGNDNPNAMLMAPGQRIDVLVQAGKPEPMHLRAIPYDQGYSSPAGPLARLVVEATRWR